MTIIVGIVGHAGEGKDTAAQYLVDSLEFRRRAFADPVRELAEKIVPRFCTQDYIAGSPEWLAAWDDVKRNNPEVRELLQNVGEGVRAVFGKRAWIEAMDEYLVRWEPTHLVIPDVRKLIEAEWVKDMGGEVWAVTRKGFGPVNGHESEAEIDEVKALADLVLGNDGTIANLHRGVEYVVETKLTDWFPAPEA